MDVRRYGISLWVFNLMSSWTQAILFPEPTCLLLLNLIQLFFQRQISTFLAFPVRIECHCGTHPNRLYFLTPYRPRPHAPWKSWSGNWFFQSSVSWCWPKDTWAWERDWNTRREISYLQVAMYYFVYGINMLMTTFLTIFWRYPNARQSFPNIFQKCPKISEELRGRTDDVSTIQQHI